MNKPLDRQNIGSSPEEQPLARLDSVQDKKDNPPIIKDEQYASKQPSKQEKLEKETQQRSYGQYLFGGAYDDPNAPDSDEHDNWSSYTLGRMGIRLFSRGVLGAGLYTWANYEVSKQMPGYAPEISMKNVEEFGKFTQYPLRYVARFFDTVYGIPIKAFVKAVSPAEKAEQWASEAVWFRSKQNYKDLFNPKRDGRSLGAEVTSMSFDFAMGSVGDAVGRQLATIADPNVKNSWDEDGHFNAKKFAKATAKEAWTIFSKNQGEDWVVALPYVYQMKAQRQAISRLYPGFKITSDRSLNGGSFRLDKEGHIEQSYAKAGALDLQLRFTGYNWYTLMYRNAYDAIGETVHSLINNGGKLDDFYIPSNPIRAAVDLTGTTVRYAAKSFIKAGIYMTPAVPAFWLFRTPQTKYKGLGFYLDPHDRMASGVAEMPNGKPFSTLAGGADFAASNGYQMQAGDVVSLKGMPLPQSPLGAHFDPFAVEHTRGVFDRMVNPFGKACYEGGEAMYKALEPMGITPKQKPFIHDLVNASMSYTPYMITKAETALRWDNLGMDRAIYRFIDGVSSLNLGEVKGGLSDIRDQVLHPPSNRKQEEIKALEAAKEKERIRLLKEEDEKKSGKPKNKVSDVYRQAMAEQFMQDKSTPEGATRH